MKPQNNKSSLTVSRGFIKNLFFGLAGFISRFLASIKLMTKTERRLAVVLVGLAAIAFFIKAGNSYIAGTRTVPAAGGEYREAIVGGLKYLNPVLAQSNADKSSTGLIFSGLTKIDKNGVNPDIAEKWEISPDGLTYIFSLKKNVFFHDGANLKAEDVLYTIDQIKTVNTDGSKSPLYDAWKDVEADAPDDYHVVFTLPRAYGPFIYNTDVGILPGHISPDEFGRRFIGSGLFKFKSQESKNGKTTLSLERNNDYYQTKAMLDSVTLTFYPSADEAQKAFADNKADAIFGADPGADSLYLSYKSSKQLGLVFNLRLDKFKDQVVRQKILAGEEFTGQQQYRLVTLDSAIQRDKAEEIKKQLARQNIELETIYLNPVQLEDVLSTKEFEILLYGFDFGYDRDLYVFWHSSQVDALNFAGYSNKDADIFLEDARMVVDPVERNKRYDQFLLKIQNESLAKFYDPVKYSFYVSPQIKGISAINGTGASSRFDHICDWYVKEKRVKK